MPEYDFSTTRDAMKSMIKAAKKQEIDGFRRGISKGLLEKTLAESSDLSEPMREWAKLTYHHQVSQEGDAAVARMDNKERKSSFKLPLVRENGDWKVALPEE